MSIKKLTEQLDAELTKEWAAYIDLHNELNAHRGKVLQETDMPEVNRLLKDIQNKFTDLYYAFNFINYRHQMALNAMTGYDDFINTLKKAGAEEQYNETNKNNKKKMVIHH